MTKDCKDSVTKFSRHASCTSLCSLIIKSLLDSKIIQERKIHEFAADGLEIEEALHLILFCDFESTWDIFRLHCTSSYFVSKTEWRVSFVFC